MDSRVLSGGETPGEIVKKEDSLVSFSGEGNHGDYSHVSIPFDMMSTNRSVGELEDSVSMKYRSSMRSSMGSTTIAPSILESVGEQLVEGVQKNDIEGIKETLTSWPQSVNYKTVHGCNPFLVAAACGSVKAMQLMVKVGRYTNFSYADKGGHTAMHEACVHNRADVVRFLLVFCRLKEVNLKNCSGCTPLHMCALNNAIQACDALLNDCPPNVLILDETRDVNNQTAAQVARKLGNTRIAHMIEERKSYVPKPSLRETYSTYNSADTTGPSRLNTEKARPRKESLFVTMYTGGKKVVVVDKEKCELDYYLTYVGDGAKKEPRDPSYLRYTQQPVYLDGHVDVNVG